MPEHTDVVVIGAGQSGLALSYRLTEQNRRHVVLEQDRPIAAWRDRWDSFALNTQSGRSLDFPGLPYHGSAPEDYAPRDEVIAYFDDYIRLFNPPLRLGVTATAVRASDNDRFVVESSEGVFSGQNVVIATGRNRIPHIPSLAAALPPSIVHMHTRDYRNPDLLPPGNTLIVGSGQSSCQIVEEIQASGRTVYLSLGSNGRIPIHYRGSEASNWYARLDESWSHLVGAQVTGRDGGRTLDVHQFARDGVVLLGRLRGSDGTRVTIAPDLHERLAAVDAYDLAFRHAVDAFIAANGLDAPAATLTEPLYDGYNQPIVTDLDLAAVGITSIIWGTGYRFDLGWVHFPVLDAAGEPVQERGVTSVPGLYVLGFNLNRRPRSAFLPNGHIEATFVAEHIAGRG